MLAHHHRQQRAVTLVAGDFLWVKRRLYGGQVMRAQLRVGSLLLLAVVTQ